MSAFTNFRLFVITFFLLCARLLNDYYRRLNKAEKEKRILRRRTVVEKSRHKKHKLRKSLQLFRSYLSGHFFNTTMIRMPQCNENFTISIFLFISIYFSVITMMWSVKPARSRYRQDSLSNRPIVRTITTFQLRHILECFYDTQSTWDFLT